MEPDGEVVSLSDAPDRVKMLLHEGYDLCAATALSNHRSVGRGIVLLAFDMSINRIVCLYISRNQLYEPTTKNMFSDAAWQSIRKLTKSYDMRYGFCVVLPDAIDDVFYTLRLPYTSVGPQMSNAELNAVINAYPKQETDSTGRIGAN